MFLEKLKKEVDDNLTNDQFSVEELAKRIGMSRSQLHRKLNSATGQSVSQFIREYRLQLGMELLKTGELTAAEVADRVGFGSPTYFSKCFNEFYGFPPGEVKSKLSSGALDTKHATSQQSDSNYKFPSGGSDTSDKITLSPRRIFSGRVIVIGIVILVAIGMTAFFYYREKESIPVQRGGKSIAILPFKNLSEDKGNEYFSEGIIEAIRTGLSQLGDLRVISRTSVEQYRETDKTAREIAGELGVSALLEGSVQRNENKVRIDVRLIDGTTEAQVWAKSYDRELEDVFAIQSEIAEQVADELHAKLSAAERSKLLQPDTDNPEAYDLFLRGMYEYRTYTNKGAHHAIDLFTKVIALDPNFPRAYAWLANSYIGLATIWGAELSAIDALEKGKPLIDKALELDPDLDQAHMLMGFYRLYHDWDLKQAEAEYEQGIKFEHPDAIAMYIDYLNFVSQHEKAMFWSERLNDNDPYYPNSRMVLSYIYLGKFEEALKFSEARVQLFNNYYTFDAHGFLLLNVNRYKEAIVYFNKAIDVEGIRYPRMLGWMGAAYAKAGERDKALQIIAELKGRLPKERGGSIAFFTSVIYAALKDKPSAMLWLKEAYKSHDMEMPWLMTEPQFYVLHDEPEFQKMAKEMGFK